MVLREPTCPVLLVRAPDEEARGEGKAAPSGEGKGRDGGSKARSGGAIPARAATKGVASAPAAARKRPAKPTPSAA
jgi:hypothetical protein